MTLVLARIKVHHPNPKLASAAGVRRALKKLLADAARSGWSMEKTNNEMEKVLRNLQITYSDGAPGKRGAAGPGDREPVGPTWDNYPEDHR